MTRQILLEFDHSSGHAKRDDGAVVPSDLRKFSYTREDADYPKDIPVTAEGLGEYCYDDNGTLIEGKLIAGKQQTFTFAATEGPFDLKNPAEKVVYDRGHVLILSPKYHPELAGVGIEYCWGQSKYRFRNRYNDQEAKNLKANVLATFDPNQLTPEVSLAYARKTRDYRMTYKTIMTEKIGTVNTNKGNIEKIRKNHKCHRNILDQEIGFIRNVLKEEKIEHDVVEL